MCSEIKFKFDTSSLSLCSIAFKLTFDAARSCAGAVRGDRALRVQAGADVAAERRTICVPRRADRREEVYAVHIRGTLFSVFDMCVWHVPSHIPSYSGKPGALARVEPIEKVRLYEPRL